MINETRVKISGGGRVVIPSEIRRKLQLKEGDELIMRLDQVGIRLLTKKQAIREAQEVIHQYVPKNRSLADELIAERREEYESE